MICSPTLNVKTFEQDKLALYILRVTT